MNGKGLFILATIFLWGAFSVTVYNWATIALNGGLFSQLDFTILGVALIASVIFTYLTKIIIEKA